MSKTRKKVIKILVIVAAGIGALLIVGFLLLALFRQSVFFFLDALFEPPVCEMEEWEKELLIEEFSASDEETIREGRLYWDHLEMLNEIREGMAYLEEKYPDYKFHINYRDDWAVTIIDYGVTEETTGESFRLRFYTDEERRHRPEDDFYVYFIEDAYQEYLEKQFMQRSNKVMAVVINITRTKGKEYNDKITLNDITSGRLDVSPLVNVRISAGDMTEEECARYVEMEMQKAIEEIDLSGTYGMDFFPNMEETRKEGEKIKLVYYKTIFWERKGENDG